MLRAGVIGCGHLGKFHIKQLSESKRYQLAGIYDKNLDIAKVVSKEFNCNFFKWIILTMLEILCTKIMAVNVS